MEKITKLEAARQQLEIAIRLFFEDKSAVAVHTLTAAAHGILTDIGRKTKLRTSLLKDSDLIPEGKRQQWVEILNRPANFFKHADRDPFEALEFNSEGTEFLLFDAIWMYREISGKRAHDGTVFLVWFITKYPQFVKPGEFRDQIEKLMKLAGGPLTKAGSLKILNDPSLIGT